MTSSNLHAHAVDLEKVPFPIMTRQFQNMDIEKAYDSASYVDSEFTAAPTLYSSTSTSTSTSTLSKTPTATATSPRPDVPGIFPPGPSLSGKHHDGGSGGAVQFKTYTPVEWVARLALLRGLGQSYVITGMKYCQYLNPKRRGFGFALRDSEFLLVDLKSKKTGEEHLVTTIRIVGHPSPTSALAQGRVTIIVPIHPPPSFGETAPDLEYRVLSQSAFDPTLTVPPRARHLAKILRSVKVRSAPYELHRLSRSCAVKSVFWAMRKGFHGHEVAVEVGGAGAASSTAAGSLIRCSRKPSKNLTKLAMDMREQEFERALSRRIFRLRDLSEDLRKDLRDLREDLRDLREDLKDLREGLRKGLPLPPLEPPTQYQVHGSVSDPVSNLAIKTPPGLTKVTDESSGNHGSRSLPRSQRRSESTAGWRGS